MRGGCGGDGGLSYWCSISGETAAAKGTAGWPAQGGGQGKGPSS